VVVGFSKARPDQQYGFDRPPQLVFVLDLDEHYGQQNSALSLFDAAEQIRTAFARFKKSKSYCW